MTKRIISAVVSLILGMGIGFAIPNQTQEAVVEKHNNTYADVLMVTNYNKEEIELTCQNGNQWLYNQNEDTEFLEVGCLVAVIFDDNGTKDNVLDDKIVDWTYGGFVDDMTIQTWVKE